MTYGLLDRYYIEQNDDRVKWFRVFPTEKKLMVGNGVYRDDVLILLFPDEVNDIVDLEAVLSQLAIESLPQWNKTKYLIHMGNVNSNYSVDEAIRCDTGEDLTADELREVVRRVETVF